MPTTIPTRATVAACQHTAAPTWPLTNPSALRRPISRRRRATLTTSRCMSVAAPNNASMNPTMSGKFTASPKLISEMGVVGRVAHPDMEPSKEKGEQPHDPNLVLVKSPIVGTFYEAASPEAPPFVRVGERVQPGKVLCIIESMKLMNEIESETSGIIESKLVMNGQPVEYGEALFAVRTV